MDIVPLVIENLCVVAIPIILEQTVSTEMFALTICVNIIQHVLTIDQPIPVNVQRVIPENIVIKLTIVSAVRVKMLESVSIMFQVSHADAWIISLAQTVKPTNSAWVKVVLDTESVCRNTMGTIATVLRDT